MTRCRCASRHQCSECGAWLATEQGPAEIAWDVVLVHPCGACLQEARADALAGYEDNREPPVDESRD